MTLANTSFQLIGDGSVGTPLVMAQGAPLAPTANTQLVAADLGNALINYTGAGHNLTLPTAAAMDDAFPNFPVNGAMDFSVTATTGTATLVTNTGWTIGTGCRLTTAATTGSRYRARKTAAGAWTLYLIG